MAIPKKQPGGKPPATPDLKAQQWVVDLALTAYDSLVRTRESLRTRATVALALLTVLTGFASMDVIVQRHRLAVAVPLFYLLLGIALALPGLLSHRIATPLSPRQFLEAFSIAGDPSVLSSLLRSICAACDSMERVNALAASYLTASLASVILGACVGIALAVLRSAIPAILLGMGVGMSLVSLGVYATHRLDRTCEIDRSVLQELRGEHVDHA